MIEIIIRQLLGFIKLLLGLFCNNSKKHFVKIGGEALISDLYKKSLPDSRLTNFRCDTKYTNYYKLGFISVHLSTAGTMPSSTISSRILQRCSYDLARDAISSGVPWGSVK